MSISLSFSPAPESSPVLFALGASEAALPTPVALQAEATVLASLVHHREYVDHFVALEVAYGAFRTRQVDFMAVVREGRVIGLCSRGQIGFIMGSRFGFALYSHSPVQGALVPSPLIVSHDTPVRAVLDRALARTGDGFHEDVVLVGRDAELIGLIQAETLAQLQSQLVAEQLEALRRQHETLRQQNLELFRASHAARQSQGRYLGLFEGHTLGVALLDPEGNIHEHNRRLGELLGCGDAPAALLSLPAWIEEKERPAFLALLGAHARGQGAAAQRASPLARPPRARAAHAVRGIRAGGLAGGFSPPARRTCRLRPAAGTGAHTRGRRAARSLRGGGTAAAPRGRLDVRPVFSPAARADGNHHGNTLRRGGATIGDRSAAPGGERPPAGEPVVRGRRDRPQSGAAPDHRRAAHRSCATFDRLAPAPPLV